MTKLQFLALTAGMFLIMKILLVVLVSRGLSPDKLEEKYDSYDKLIKDWEAATTRAANL